jgi:hypothetical protein
MRDALSAVLALAPAPHGFTVGEFAAKVHALTGTSDAQYSIRQAAYDLRKLRGKQLIDKPARDPQAASDKGSLECLGALRVPTTQASSTMTKKAMAQAVGGT